MLYYFAMVRAMEMKLLYNFNFSDCYHWIKEENEYIGAKMNIKLRPN